MKATRSTKPAIPEEFLDAMAERFRLLGDATRLAILKTLMDGERSVGEIVRETSKGQANVSKHLKQLHDAGLVCRRKAGLQVFYALDDPLVERLCRLVCETIVEEAKADLEQRRRLLKRWGS